MDPQMDARWTPNGPQMDPKLTLQNEPKRPQGEPKRPQDEPKRPQDEAKRPQNPRGSNVRPRGKVLWFTS